MAKLLASGIEPRSVELLDTTCISAINNSLAKSIAPFPLKPHIFFRVSGSADIVPKQQKALTSVLAKAGGTQLRIARNTKEAEDLWDIRKNLAYRLIAAFPGSEIISADVCVPISRLPALIEQYKRDEEKINADIEQSANGENVKRLSSLILGHVGDGNFHSMM